MHRLQDWGWKLAALFATGAQLALGVDAVTAPKLPIAFEPNRGQFANDVALVSRGAGFQLALLDGGVAIHFDASQDAIELRFEGSNASARWIPEEPSGARSNYLIGDAKSSRTGIQQY